MAIILPSPKDRQLMFNKQVDQTTIGDLTKAIVEINTDDEYIFGVYKLHNLEYKPEPIKIYIDSYGGYVYQCFGLLGIIENSKTPLHTIVTGCAMSAGFLTSITGHKRYAYSKATFMYHQISSAAWGTAKELEDELIETERLQKMIEKHTLRHTKMTSKQLEDVYEKKKDWYITAKEAVKIGVIDKII
jgi:ATP-dependent Clp protease protease subunit